MMQRPGGIREWGSACRIFDSTLELTFVALIFSKAEKVYLSLFLGSNGAPRRVPS
jgi:hypothetical protein